MRRHGCLDEACLMNKGGDLVKRLPNAWNVTAAEVAADYGSHRLRSDG
jgi:hypothetical protein